MKMHIELISHALSFQSIERSVLHNDVFIGSSVCQISKMLIVYY